jgi:hypothetical protein
MAGRAQVKEFAKRLDIASNLVDVFHHLEQTSGLGFQIVSIIRILLFPGLFRISDFGFHCNVLCCVLGAAGAKIHSGLSAGPRLGKLGFSQRFGHFLNRFVVPSEQNNPSVNRDFNVIGFHIDRGIVFVYDSYKTFTVDFIDHAAPCSGQQRGNSAHEMRFIGNCVRHF